MQTCKQSNMYGQSRIKLLFLNCQCKGRFAPIISVVCTKSFSGRTMWTLILEKNVTSFTSERTTVLFSPQRLIKNEPTYINYVTFVLLSIRCLTQLGVHEAIINYNCIWEQHLLILLFFSMKWAWQWFGV